MDSSIKESPIITPITVYSYPRPSKQPRQFTFGVDFRADPAGHFAQAIVESSRDDRDGDSDLDIFHENAENLSNLQHPFPDLEPVRASLGWVQRCFAFNRRLGYGVNLLPHPARRRLRQIGGSGWRFGLYLEIKQPVCILTTIG